MPKTTFGWAMATAFLSLPVVLFAAAMGWLVSRTYVTPESLWAWTTAQAVDGMRGFGQTAVSAALQTDIAAWLVSQGAILFDRAGVTGIGVLLAAAGIYHCCFGLGPLPKPVPHANAGIELCCVFILT
jgi:hypothetical protein